MPEKNLTSYMNAPYSGILLKFHENLLDIYLSVKGYMKFYTQVLQFVFTDVGVGTATLPDGPVKELTG